MIGEEERRNGIILWNLGSVGEYIENTVKNTPFYNNLTSCVYVSGDTQPPELDENKTYLLFYMFTNAEDEDKARNHASINKLKVSFAALCKNDEAGIESMRKGDIYALRLPLQPDKIIRCYEHFIRSFEKKERNL